MAEFDQYRDSYSNLIDDSLKFSGADQEFFTRVKVGHLNEIIGELEIRDRSAELLDVGCGHGLIHRMIENSGGKFSLTGVDVAADVIDWAKEKNPQHDYQEYDGRRLPFADNSFDLAFSICVMHHVPPAQWSGFLREMTRVVRPKGRVVVMEHNPLNPATQYIVRSCPIDDNAVLLRRGRLRSLMAEAGLVALKSKFFIFTPFEAAIARRLDRALCRVPLGAQYFLEGEVA